MTKEEWRLHRVLNLQMAEATALHRKLMASWEMTSQTATVLQTAAS